MRQSLDLFWSVCLPQSVIILDNNRRIAMLTPTRTSVRSSQYSLTRLPLMIEVHANSSRALPMSVSTTSSELR